MALIIELSHPLGGKSIDAIGYWYGFIVHHRAQDETSKAYVRRFHAQEIAAIGLASGDDARLRGGFNWPVEHWRQLLVKGEIDRNKITLGLYVALNEVASAFPSLRNISQINLLIGRKGGEYALMQSNAAPLVTLYRDGKVQAFEIPEQVVQGQAAVLSLYAGEPVLSPVESPLWRGYPDFASGIDGYLAALSEQATASEVKATEIITRAAVVPAKDENFKLSNAVSSAAQQIVVAQPSPFAEPTISKKKPSPALSALESVEVPPKSQTAMWVAIAAVAVLGVTGLFVLKRSDLPQGPSTQVSVLPPTVQLPAPQPQNSKSTSVPSSSTSTSTDTVESIVASIAVPTGNWPMSRENLYKFGFEGQLGLIKQILDASKAVDAASFDAASEQLNTMRPTREWSKDDLAARRKFNEGIERLISFAIKTSDDRALSKAIELSEQFLTTHFGNSTAHLNLSLAQSAANRGKAALPPAIHTIIFNPDSANSWVSLGIALARSGDESGSTGAFCTALRKVNFSDKTVGFFERIGRGEDAVYSYPEVIRSIKGTAVMCPRDRWAKSISAVR